MPEISPTAIVAYLALFATVGFLFVLASLILGWFLRPQSPSREKASIYECGEPSIGPNKIQFDLRFYVVALVFLIFEVEVAFFFPPAVVFGKANQLRQSEQCAAKADATCPLVAKSQATVSAAYAEFGVPKSSILDKKRSPASAAKSAEETAGVLSLTAMLDLAVFFAVLLVGFAFVWSRGDLNWVRSTRHPTTTLETAVIMSKMRKGELG